MKSKFILFALLVMAAALAFAASNASEEHNGAANDQHTIIKMRGYHFVPDKITIDAGTTVEWINTGEYAHTVTDEHKSWDSGDLKPGEKFSHRFETKGTVKYYCIPHEESGMTGTIIVK